MTRTDRAVWQRWMTSVLAVVRDAAARAVLEEPQLADLLDPEDVRPVLVIDAGLRRCDVWFKGATRGSSIHAGHIAHDGTWHPAAVAPAVASAGEVRH